MNAKDRILLVEDHAVNRAIIKNILGGFYDIVEAENGQAALELLDAEHETIAGIVLDLRMPVMDGMEFLRRFTQIPAYANIPILVTTAAQNGDEERACLKLGAWDFIRKPIDSDLLKLRLKNIIGRSQSALAKQLRYVAEHDGLTGLYNHSRFLTAARQLLERAEAGRPYAMLHVNVKNFRMVNSFFGSDAGDALLQFLAQQLRGRFSATEEAALGRLDADVFCVCAPLTDPEIDETAAELQAKISAYKPNYYLKLSFGVYQIADRSVPVETMCGCAEEAARLVTCDYQSPVIYYQQAMSEAAVLEQQIMSEAQAALDTGQFEVFLQPKYDLARKCAYGAEALARWKHPTRGMISPGVFIPVFEKNGFVSKLDFCIWEQTCQLLRKWTDEGRKPSPVSVNISRVNMYNPQLVSIIKALVDQYDLPPALLNLELTESAYMDNPEQMKHTVMELQQAGFLIMMDDFGSGYSSLNTLKDIPIDVLKVDMRFLPTQQEDGRSERILASVIRMAGWLGMDVIVEGVETKDQLNFLESTGCGYVQGFYFAKPMCVSDYESFLQTRTSLSFIRQPAPGRNRTMQKLIWSAAPEMCRIFDSIMSPLAVFEYGDGICDPVRVNEAFREAFGAVRQNLREQINTTMLPKDAQSVLEAFHLAAKIKGDARTKYLRYSFSGKQKFYRLCIRYIQDSGNGVLLMALFSSLDGAHLRSVRRGPQLRLERSAAP